MITLHIAKLLADNGFGTLVLTGTETGSNLLYFEKLPIGKNGVFIVSRGAPLSRGQRTVQAFDLYARGSNDIDGAKRLNDILKFFSRDFGINLVCDLPIVTGYSTNKYSNVIIEPTQNISNVGQDNADRVIYLASAKITYKENQ